MSTENSAPPSDPSHFIRDIVAADVAAGRYSQIVTRFPPEPNGYLHIGHAKSICLNFGIAREFGGVCHLRMDDTNPAKEDVEYVHAITEDVQWLIQGWADSVLRFKKLGAKDGHAIPATEPDSEPFYASDYFQRLHDYAVELIRAGKAYVCDLTPEETDRFRGAPDKEGIPSPFRDRTVEENLDLFARMKAGEFPDGARTLRAKIDMTSRNVWLRDPLLYRIRHTLHHHSGSEWCIYPLYDFAHCLSDSIEGITHSICTLEFEVHRPLYDWILDNLNLPQPRPHQYEFARLNLGYTVMSKRKLMQLVREGRVTGWDDPRMPTICGMRRRGVTPQALRQFALQIGITKYNGLTDVAVLEHAIRSDLNQRALRRLGVLRPLKLTILNLPEDHCEQLEAVNLPDNENAGTRKIPFSRHLYIEQDDFMEVPPPKYFRLRPGGEVRLKYGYIVKCEDVVRDDSGKVVELLCTADLESKSGGPTANRKIKGTIHWVSAPHALPAEVRLYDRLFTAAEPDAGTGDFLQFLNPDSLEVLSAQLEPSFSEATSEERYQLERVGYFCLDGSSTKERPVFNRTISLKDAWSKGTQKP
jgi:glutaminyl-tRNA synthetase